MPLDAAGDVADAQTFRLRRRLQRCYLLAHQRMTARGPERQRDEAKTDGPEHGAAASPAGPRRGAGSEESKPFRVGSPCHLELFLRGCDGRFDISIDDVFFFTVEYRDGLELGHVLSCNRSRLV